MLPYVKSSGAEPKMWIREYAHEDPSNYRWQLFINYSLTGCKVRALWKYVITTFSTVITIPYGLLKCAMLRVVMYVFKDITVGANVRWWPVSTTYNNSLRVSFTSHRACTFKSDVATNRVDNFLMWFSIHVTSHKIYVSVNSRITSCNLYLYS